jgi:hypothetical protein
MKRISLLGIAVIMCLMSSCNSYPEIHSEDEAVKFLETHSFHDSDARIFSGGTKQENLVTTSFGIEFSDGNATINGDTEPYSIRYVEKGSYSSKPYYQIEMCGFERYHGCITGYLTTGIGDKHGAGLALKSRASSTKRFDASFSFIIEGDITKK